MQVHPVVDAHLDLPGEIYYRQGRGEKDIIKNHYLAHFEEAGIALVVAAVYVESSDLPEKGLRIALRQINALLEEIESMPDRLLLVKSAADIDRVLAEKRIGFVLHLEGLDPLGSDVNLLRTFHSLGVRSASLTWSRRNAFGEGCCRAGQDIQIEGHLSQAGRDAIATMEKMGILLDISHLNDDGIADVMADAAKKPYFASHSNCRSVHRHYRNITDKQIRHMATQGGVLGLNAYKSIVGATPGTAEAIGMCCDHVERMWDIGGEDAAGIGLDLCDSYYEAVEGHVQTQSDCLKHHGELVLVTAELLARGHGEEKIAKWLGGNFIRFFQQTWR